MGKSVRTNNDPYVLDDQDLRAVKPKSKPAATVQEKDPLVLGDDDKGFVKKKAPGSDSGGGGFPTPSGLSSGNTVDQAAKNYADKKLTVQDQDVLATTDWGKAQGLNMPDEWKKSYVQAHNGPKTSELVGNVMSVLNANYPQAPPGTPQASARDQIFSSVQKGDVPAIQKVKNSIIDQKQQQILQIRNNPQGPDVPSGIIGQPVYAQSSVRALSPEQEQQVKVLQDQINSAGSTLDAFTAHAIVNNKEIQTQLKVEVLPANTKYTDLTIAADNIGAQLEKTVGINKSIPNAQYSRTKAGLEAIMTSLNMDVNDLMAQGMRSKNPDLLKQAQEKIDQIKIFQTRYENLDNNFPDVGVYKTARYIGDILAETKPNRLITTSEDVHNAAAVAESRTPGFLQSHGKFVDVVAKSEGDWIGVKSGLVPQGGFIGGVKAGAENIGYSGAAFAASPFGMTVDQRTLDQANAWLADPQMKGTSKSGVQPTRVVYDKESKAYREVPNESYGTWDFNSSMYSLGKAIPTLAEWVVLDKGIGGLAKGGAMIGIKGLNLIGEGVAAGTNAAIGAKEAMAGYEALKLAPGFEKAAGLYGTTYVTSFDENRKLADNLIEDKTSLGDAKKNALANILTLTTAGLFSIAGYSPTKAVEATLSKSIAPRVLDLLEKSSWESLSEEETAKLMKDAIWPRIKAIVQAGAKGAGEGMKLGAISVIDQKIKDFAGLMVNPKKAKTSSIEDNLHTFVDQVLLMSLVGLPNMVQSGAFPQTAKDAMYQAGVLAPQYIDRINERAAHGDIDQGQANKMISMIKTMSEEIGNVQTAVNKDGLPLSTRQKREVAINNFRKRAAAMLEESGTPIGKESVEKEADKNTDTVRQENSWRNMEESVPFQTARDVETGKHPGGIDDIDPDKEYTYQKGPEMVTTTGAELSDHLINGDYEQAKTEKTETLRSDNPAESNAPQTEEPGADAEGEPAKEKENVEAGKLDRGKAAIEKAVSDGKIAGVYALMAKSNPETFLKEIADQALGRTATGEDEAAGQAEKVARENYTDEVVDAAIDLYPLEDQPTERPTIVIRHGQSEANAKRRVSTDETPLTKLGEKQAKVTGVELAEQGYTDVVSSATLRTRQTAYKILEQTGGKLIDAPKLSLLLKEWDQGSGETMDQFAARMAEARTEIDKLPPGTAVVAHGKVMAMLDALDKAGGDVKKAKKEFESTKVYGNAETYIPSPKKQNNATEKGSLEEGNQEGSNRSPERGKEGHGQQTAGGDTNAGQAAQKGNDAGQQEGHVLNQEGAAPPEGAAPSLPTRQSRVNDLLDVTSKYNKLRKNDPNKAEQLNNIRLEAKELGLKVDYAKGFVTLRNANGKEVQRRSEETNQTKAKNFSLDNYSDRAKRIVNDLVGIPNSLASVDIPGFDGKSMSEAQKVNALDDIRHGNMTNGAKAIYDVMHRVSEEGFVELIDPSTRQRIGVPLDEYMSSISQEIKPLTDDQLTELNTMLGEESFGKIFDDIFAEETQLPNEEQGTPSATEPTQQPPPGDTGEGAPTPGASAADTGTSEPPGAPPEEPPAPEEEESAKVTGIRNIVVNAERMDRSLEPVIKEARAGFQDVWDSALHLVRSGEADPRSLVASLNEQKKPKVSDIDNALILMDRIDLTNQRIELLRGIEAADKDGNDMTREALSLRLDDVERKIQQNDEVADRTGQETARALSSRRMLATMDYSLSKLTADIRRFYPDNEVPPSVLERLSKIEKDHEELLRKYGEREEQWKAEQAEKAFHAEQAQTKKPAAKPGNVALKGKALADKIRSLRPKGGNTAQSNLFGLPIAVYDTALVTIANLVENLAKLPDAINEVVKTLTFDTDEDRDGFIQHLLDFEQAENQKASTPEGMRANLVSEIVEKAKEQKASTLVKDNITPLRKLARSYIKEGVADLGSLVEKIHADLAPDLPDLTTREVRDAFSGYGDVKLESRNEIERQLRDLKKQGELVSQFEDVMEGLQPDRKKKAPSKASKKVQELKKALETSMKENGITWDNPPRNKQEQAGRALQAVKNRLKTQIESLETQIHTGQAQPPAGRNPVELDQEGKDLREARDRLKEMLAQTESGTRLSDQMRIKRLENALQKQISVYETAIREGTDPFKPKAERVSTPQIDALRTKRNAIRDLYRKLRVDNNPNSSPQQIALEAYKDRISKRINTLRRRTAEGDFEPKERDTINKDAGALKLDLKLKSVESEFYAMKAKAEKANRTLLQKAFDKLNAYKRFAILSGFPSLGKIGLAVVYRTVGTPIEELVGVPLRFIPGVSTVARQAPREGRGFRLGTEGSALREWSKADSYRDWLQVFKKGRGELDVRQGKYLEENPEFLEFFGRVHASLKNFAKRSEFARSYEARMDYARRQGFDTSDPEVHLTAAADAYLDANRSIFMQENRLTREYFKMIKRMEASDSGWQYKVGAFLARFTIPIVKVPTNFIAETGDFAFGALTGLSRIVYNAVTGELSRLSPKEADTIMRSLKKGSIGLTMMTLGYLLPGVAGGFWQRGEKRDPDEPDAGEFLIGGHHVPKWATHFPLLEAMQIGATLRRSHERRAVQKGEEPGKAVTGSIFDAVGGVLGEVPLFEQPDQLFTRIRYGEWDKAEGEYLKSLNPQLIQNVASWTDTDDGQTVKRSPQTTLETVMTGIPGLREQVPRK